MQELRTHPLRHLHVKKEKIGRVSTNCFEGFAAVARFTHDRHLRIALEHLAQYVARERLIVDQQYANQGESVIASA